MARKRKSKPTTKKRSERQKLKDRYMHAREDAQLAGLIPTTPEDALGSERVDPESQGNQPLPGLVGRAIRNGWATPEEKKPDLVDEMIEIVEGGEEIEAHVKVAAFRALALGDQQQWERDNPELAGKTKGGTKVDVNVENKTQVNLLELAREAITRDPLEDAKREVRDG